MSVILQILLYTNIQKLKYYWSQNKNKNKNAVDKETIVHKQRTNLFFVVSLIFGVLHWKQYQIVRT